MAPTPTNPEEHEPARLKSLAETQNSKNALKYPKRPPQLQGISELVNSLNIISAPDFYSVLDVEPSADSNTIQNQNNKTLRFVVIEKPTETALTTSETTSIVGYMRDRMREEEVWIHLVEER